MAGQKTAQLRDIMAAFAEETELDPATDAPTRYLWTDAFALCNFIELFRRTDDERFRELALRLVDQVHEVLGRHRADDSRSGWISGLGEEEGRRHPTVGGLRIGKPLNERGPGEPFDDRLEWERDGQYFHYLTKWMHALDCLSRVTGEARYSLWALELAKSAGPLFMQGPTFGGRKRLVWKMSIDLSRPLVPSMGQHDPLDGYVTFRELQMTSERRFAGAGPDLCTEIEGLGAICRGIDWATEDPLGIGGLLFDACRTAQLALEGEKDLAELLQTILDGAIDGIKSPSIGRSLALPAECRLAFRELGLAIGLEAVPRIKRWIEKAPEAFGTGVRKRIDTLEIHLPLGARITAFWGDPANRGIGTWSDHLEINRVMLATGLAPDGFLGFDDAV